MNKGVIGLIIAIIIIVVAVAGFVVYRSSNTNIDNNIIKEEARIEENTVSGDSTENKNIANSGSNILVVYYSAQNHTKSVAEKIAKNLNADIFEIVPEDVYTSDDLNWTNSNSRVSREHNDESLRDVKLKNTKVNNWEDYDTVLIGYPIWWGIAAWPVDNFVKDNNFDGKKVIPFCTSSSSDLGQSGKLLQKEANSGNWMDGHRFSSNASDSDIQEWTDNLK
jgi:menaquinone-dependent protoporphyrinogen IX oxidase